RHTSFSRDWSSDVCSSDLTGGSSSLPAAAAGVGRERPAPPGVPGCASSDTRSCMSLRTSSRSTRAAVPPSPEDSPSDLPADDPTSLGPGRSGADGALIAREAGLKYVGDDMPGIVRRRAGKGFSYRGPDGERVTDRDTLARIQIGRAHV